MILVHTHGAVGTSSMSRANRFLWYGTLTMATVVGQGCGEPGRAHGQIALDTILVLDMDGAPELPRPGAVVAYQERNDIYVVSPSTAPSELMVFDSLGRYRHGVGRRGAGPGEFQGVSALTFDSGDSLWVVGPGSATIWTPDLTFHRRVPTDVRAHDVAPARGGGVYVSGMTRAPEEIGYAVRMIRSDGSRRLMAEREGSTDMEQAGARRSLGAARAGGFWLAEFEQFRIERFAEDGSRISRFHAAPEWWVPLDLPQGLEDRMHGSPAILDVGSDERGRLWVTAGVPILNEHVRQKMLGADPQDPTALLPVVSDHHILLLDEANGAVLADELFDYLPLYFLDEKRAWALLPDEDIGFGVVIYAMGDSG